MQAIEQYSHVESRKQEEAYYTPVYIGVRVILIYLEGNF